MKKINKALLVFSIGAVTILSSCQSLTPFNNEVRTTYNLDEAKLKKMQFYISIKRILMKIFSQNC